MIIIRVHPVQLQWRASPPLGKKYLSEYCDAFFLPYERQSIYKIYFRIIFETKRMIFFIKWFRVRG